MKKRKVLRRYGEVEIEIVKIRIRYIHQSAKIFQISYLSKKYS